MFTRKPPAARLGTLELVDELKRRGYDVLRAGAARELQDIATGLSDGTLVDGSGVLDELSHIARVAFPDAVEYALELSAENASLHERVVHSEAVGAVLFGDAVARFRNDESEAA